MVVDVVSLAMQRFFLDLLTFIAVCFACYCCLTQRFDDFVIAAVGFGFVGGLNLLALMGQISGRLHDIVILLLDEEEGVEYEEYEIGEE